MARNLYPMFFPRTIMIVGASPDVQKHSGALLKRAIDSGFYKDSIFLVNPKHQEIMGCRCYPAVDKLPVTPDVAFVTVPAKAALGVLKECIDCGIKNVVMITAGFKEIGGEGVELEKQLVALANKHKINMLGPNCPGFISSSIHFGMTDSKVSLHKDGVVLISQSGGMNALMADVVEQWGQRFRLMVGMGNKAQLDEEEILQSINDYPRMLNNQRVIGLYLESLNRPREFLKVAQKLRRQGIALVVFKAGRGAVAQKAAYSHTGALANSEVALNALLEKAGVVRVDDIHDFVATLLILVNQELFKVGRVAVLTNSGGVGVITTDALEQVDLPLAELSAETHKRLRVICEKHGIWHSPDHPVDLIGGGKPELFFETAKELMQRPEVDTLVISFVRPPLAGYDEATAKQLSNLQYCFSTKKVVIVNVGVVKSELRKIYQAAGLLVFDSPDAAMRVLGIIDRITKSLEKKTGRVKKFNIIQSPSISPRYFLGCYGLKLPKKCLVPVRCVYNDVDRRELVDEFKRARHSLLSLGVKKAVMKIESSDIVHKTEVGGVVLNVNVENEREFCCTGMGINDRYSATGKEQDSKVLIQEMIEGGYEILLGVKKEPGFGHLIGVGEGGVYAEARNDVVFGLAPLTPAEARAMVEKLRFYKILRGVRGQLGANVDLIVDALLRLSQLVTDFPQIAELDINPAKVDAKRLICLDARIKLEEVGDGEK